MPHCIEEASSGRSRCRGCGGKIAKGAQRFGERVDNPFGDGEATYWFHLTCAALMRPEPMLSTLEGAEGCVPSSDALLALAKAGIEYRRLPRLMRVERASSGRARCRSCRELIEKETWRFAVAMFEDGRMNPIGFLHVGCSQNYFDTADVLPRVDLLQPDLSGAERAEVATALATQAPPQAVHTAEAAGPSVAKAVEAPASPTKKRSKA